MAIFEPVRAVRKLRDNGVPEPAAEATVEVVQEAAEAATSELATKADLAALRAEMRAEFEKQRAEMRAEFEKQRGEMYRGQNRLMIITFGMATTIALIAIGIVEFM